MVFKSEALTEELSPLTHKEHCELEMKVMSPHTHCYTVPVCKHTICGCTLETKSTKTFINKNFIVKMLLGALKSHSG